MSTKKTPNSSLQHRYLQKEHLNSSTKHRYLQKGHQNSALQHRYLKKDYSRTHHGKTDICHYCFLCGLKFPLNFCMHLEVSMSVGWDVKWCPVSRITTPLVRKKPLLKSRLVRADRETSKLMVAANTWYMAEILPIQHKTLSKQSLEVSKPIKYSSKPWNKAFFFLSKH